MDEITLTEVDWAWKVQIFTFLPFLVAQNSSHTQTFKYKSRAQFSSQLLLYFFLEMRATMSSITINNYWKVQKTPIYGSTILLRSCIWKTEDAFKKNIDQSGARPLLIFIQIKIPYIFLEHRKRCIDLLMHPVRCFMLSYHCVGHNVLIETYHNRPQHYKIQVNW